MLKHQQPKQANKQRKKEYNNISWTQHKIFTSHYHYFYTKSYVYFYQCLCGQCVCISSVNLFAFSEMLFAIWLKTFLLIAEKKGKA